MQPLVLALIGMLGFLVITSLIFLIRYGTLMDKQLLQYYLAFGAMGALSLALRRYGFGFIFLSGAGAGLVVDCVVSFLEGLRPTMSGGIYNILIILLGAVIGVVVEIRLQRAE